LSRAALSAENVEIVRDSFEAFRAGEYERAMKAFAPEIEYDLSHFPEGIVYRGHEGVREAFRIWMGAFEDYRQELDELIDVGDDHVVVVLRECGRGKGSGVEVERLTVGAWTFREGRAIRIRFYDTKEDALAALGAAD
jgi:ketosteroid isomerase-like protein